MLIPRLTLHMGGKRSINDQQLPIISSKSEEILTTFDSLYRLPRFYNMQSQGELQLIYVRT